MDMVRSEHADPRVFHADVEQMIASAIAAERRRFASMLDELVVELREARDADRLPHGVHSLDWTLPFVALAEKLRRP